ncbi:hypothetical protein LNP02_28865 [Klebsiella variicola subsp. variicola]|nr:hypothetical protein [Klebsiella variicola subsp. variicola]
MKFIIATLVAVSCVVFIVISFYKNTSQLNFSCSSYIQHDGFSKGMSMSANIFFIFRPDGKGMVTLDGEVYNKDHTYNLSRTIKFNYAIYGEHIYALSEKKEVINNKDTLPGNMFEDNYYSSSDVYISHIDNIRNAILIGSRILPVSVCIIN